MNMETVKRILCYNQTEIIMERDTIKRVNKLVVAA